jgi:hypothetical protein
MVIKIISPTKCSFLWTANMNKNSSHRIVLQCIEVLVKKEKKSINFNFIIMSNYRDDREY